MNDSNPTKSRSLFGLATKRDLETVRKHIMSAITDWAAKEQADLAGIKTSLDTITAGIAALDTLIKNLQNSPGTLNAADQAALDAIEAQSAALAVQAQAINTVPPA